MSRSLLILTVSLTALGLFNEPRVASAGPTVNATVGQTVLIQPDAWYPSAFQFTDGRISVGWNGQATEGRWSTDGGRTWRIGTTAPAAASIELGGGEVLSLGFVTAKRADGKYTLPQQRSLNGWTTATPETSVLDIPQSVPSGGDDGNTYPGFFMDHGILRLNDGRLMATMYGNYGEDTTPADGFPVSYNVRKYRTITVFSSDNGKTWGDPVTVADPSMFAVTHEGPCEADLARTANGDILCAMRASGMPGNLGPSYISRSTDEGRTWSAPTQMLDRGVWPNLLTMSNGIVVCATGRDGNWLTFSKDNGFTWENELCFLDAGPYPSTSSYINIFEVAPNTLLAVYDRTPASGQGHEIVGTFFTISVPEPSPVKMLVTGVLVLLAIAWRRNSLRRSASHV
jgi:hypothetical protein